MGEQEETGGLYLGIVNRNARAGLEEEGIMQQARLDSALRPRLQTDRGVTLAQDAARKRMKEQKFIENEQRRAAGFPPTPTQ
jgi:hypothetical protein